MLSKTDIAAIRKADSLCIHLNARHPNGLVRLIKRKPYNAQPFETDQEYVLANEHVTMETTSGRDALERGIAECFSLVSIYHSQGCPSSSILKTLRAGDELTFSFYPDCHSQMYVARAGLHADCLYLHVRRNGKRHTFELESSICPENSARMCRGVPASESYAKAAVEGRALV
jgi:hypothetical protein